MLSHIILAKDREVIHAFFGIFDTTILFGKIHQHGYLIWGNRAVFYLHGQCPHIIVASTVESIYDRQCKLAFCHIIARRFAYLRRLRIVEDIILDLKHDTKISAEEACLFNILITTAGRERTYSAASLKESSRFLYNHIIIDIL